MAIKEQDILNTLRQLSPEHQEEVADFIQELLEEQKEAARRPHKHVPSSVLAGILLRPGQTSPTDEEVEQWIHEARMKKYGGQ